MSQARGQFSSKLGFILAAAGVGRGSWQLGCLSRHGV